MGNYKIIILIMLTLDDFKEIKIENQKDVFGGGIPTTWIDSRREASGTDVATPLGDGTYYVTYQNGGPGILC